MIPKSHRRGFTLIELMIVVAIVGVVASIAIPTFIRYQLRARTSEASVNLKAIASAERAYFSEFGSYASVAAPVPSSLPGSGKLPWPATSAFDPIGWRPEGGVQFQYRIGADAAGGSGGNVRFTAEASADLDVDGQPSFFAYVSPAPGVGGLPGALPGSTCVGSGVYTASGPNAFDVAGPCDAASGRSRF